jgi:hypothetical protein
MTYLDAQQEILAQLNSIPNIDVYGGMVDDGKLQGLIANANQIRPFIAVSWGALTKPHTQTNGIAGAALDSHSTNFIVHAVASTDDTSQRVWQLAWNKLIGFVPTNCGEINAALFGGVGEVSVMGNPTRYSATQAYTFVVNSDLN